MEKTLVILKPDAIQRGIMGEVISRFEKVGLKVVGMKMMKPDEEQFYKHYEDIGKMVSRRGEDIFKMTLAFMMQGPVVAMVLEGIEAVSLVRKMVGETEPKTSQPGTIRGDYTHMSYKYADANNMGIPNVIHASGSVDEAEQEVYHWFNDDELFNYDVLNEVYTRGKSSKKAKK